MPPPRPADKKTAQSLAPWLDLPPGWSRTVENGVVVAMPGDIPDGAQFLLMVEAVQAAPGEISSDYEQALRDLGPWTPVGAPVDQRPGGQLELPAGRRRGQAQRAYLHGYDGRGATGLPARPLLGARGYGRHLQPLPGRLHQRHRQRSGLRRCRRGGYAGIRGADVHPVVPNMRKGLGSGTLDPSFGEGLSGVYAGWTRGLSASASGGGLGPTYDTRTGTMGSSVSAANPTMATSITDFEDLVLLLPDGTFRQGLPLRGLGSDLSYDRRSIPSRWGTWTQENGRVVVRRSGTTAVYGMRDGTLVDGRDRPWVKVAPPEARAIEGTYARADYRDPRAPRLVLRADGSYEDRGGFLRMVSSAMSLVVPDGGSLVRQGSDAEVARWLGPSRGTYVLQDFTLTLRTDDGRVWQVSAHAPAGGPPGSPDVLVIGTYRLVRESR